MSDEPEFDPTDLGLYILDDERRPVPVRETLAWAKWFEHHEELRVVKREEIGPFFISTRFFGIDMNIMRGIFGPTHPPHLFETMAFRMLDGDDRETLAQERCSTWEQAEAQHERVASVYRAMRN